MFAKDKDDKLKNPGGGSPSPVGAFSSSTDDLSPGHQNPPTDNSAGEKLAPGEKLKDVVMYIFYSSPAQTLTLVAGYRNPTTGQYTAPIVVRFHGGQVILRKDDPKVQLLLDDHRCKKSESDSGSFWFGGKWVDKVVVRDKSGLWQGPAPKVGPAPIAHEGAITTKATLIKG